MKTVYIMRGLPGSGKSTLAKKLASPSGVIHSTDDYFMVDGTYRYDRTKVREYHDCNFAAFCRSLLAGVPVVICDNTNSRRCEFQRYVDMAVVAGYEYYVIELPQPSIDESLARTTHKVPDRDMRPDIQAMIDRWEEIT